MKSLVPQQPARVEKLLRQSGVGASCLWQARYVEVRAQATCKAISDERTDVAINGAGLYMGPLRAPLGVQVRISKL
jgi:bacterioferritin-associated ferredoxin